MLRNVVTDIGGVGIYGVISICLFFAVFTGMLIWAFTQKKQTLQRNSELPLEDGTMTPNLKGDDRHE